MLLMYQADGQQLQPAQTQSGLLDTTMQELTSPDWQAVWISQFLLDITTMSNAGPMLATCACDA